MLDFRTASPGSSPFRFSQPDRLSGGLTEIPGNSGESPDQPAGSFVLDPGSPLIFASRVTVRDPREYTVKSINSGWLSIQERLQRQLVTTTGRISNIEEPGPNRGMTMLRSVRLGMGSRFYGRAYTLTPIMDESVVKIERVRVGMRLYNLPEDEAELQRALDAGKRDVQIVEMRCGFERIPLLGSDFSLLDNKYGCREISLNGVQGAESKIIQELWLQVHGKYADAPIGNTEYCRGQEKKLAENRQDLEKVVAAIGELEQKMDGHDAVIKDASGVFVRDYKAISEQVVRLQNSSHIPDKVAFKQLLRTPEYAEYTLVCRLDQLLKDYFTAKISSTDETVECCSAVLALIKQLQEQRPTLSLNPNLLVCQEQLKDLRLASKCLSELYEEKNMLKELNTKWQRELEVLRATPEKDWAAYKKEFFKKVRAEQPWLAAVGGMKVFRTLWEEELARLKEWGQSGPSSDLEEKRVEVGVGRSWYIVGIDTMRIGEAIYSITDPTINRAFSERRERDPVQILAFRATEAMRREILWDTNTADTGTMTKRWTRLHLVDGRLEWQHVADEVSSDKHGVRSYNHDYPYRFSVNSPVEQIIESDFAIRQAMMKIARAVHACKESKPWLARISGRNAAWIYQDPKVKQAYEAYERIVRETKKLIA